MLNSKEKKLMKLGIGRACYYECLGVILGWNIDKVDFDELNFAWGALILDSDNITHLINLDFETYLIDNQFGKFTNYIVDFSCSTLDLGKFSISGSLGDHGISGVISIKKKDLVIHTRKLSLSSKDIV